MIMKREVSVIIPAYNAEETIEKCLKALVFQDFPKNKYEIIVVDDGSRDRTKEMVKRFRKVKLIEQKHKGPAAARNLGVRHSSGEIILFTDADCVPPRDWIRNMIKPFEDESVVGVSGTYKTLNKKSLIARFAGYEIADRHKRMEKMERIDFVGTFSAGYRKNIFLKFRGFYTGFPTSSGEDPELSFRIAKRGYKIVFNPKAFVYHNHPDTLLKYLKQKFWRGYWRVLLYRKHKDKLFGDSYTPRFQMFHVLFTNIMFFFIFLALLKLLPPFSILLTIFLLVLSTLPFSIRMSKYEKKMFFIAPTIVLTKNILIGLGTLGGIIALSFREERKNK